MKNLREREKKILFSLFSSPIQFWFALILPVNHSMQLWSFACKDRTMNIKNRESGHGQSSTWGLLSPPSLVKWGPPVVLKGCQYAFKRFFFVLILPSYHWRLVGKGRLRPNTLYQGFQSTPWFQSLFTVIKSLLENNSNTSLL